MKRILFVAHNLEMGGVQTSLLNLLKKISQVDDYSVDLFVFANGELASRVPENVSVSCGCRHLALAATPFGRVKAGKKIFDILTRLFLTVYVRIFGSEKFFKKIFRKHSLKEEYDVAISFFNDIPGSCFNQGTNLFVSDYVKAREKIAWIHTDPIKSGFDVDICEKTYKDFDRIMCVSKSVKAGFDELLPVYSDKTEVCYNVFDEDDIRIKAKEYVPFEKSEKFNLVTVCRVDNVSKRIDKIVELCRRLKSEGITGFKWRIVGNGPHLNENLNRANELGVSDLIEFVGEKVNPYPFVQNSDVFALYSAYEGFPMVIGEALILGTKVLTTEYAAAHEQISDGQGIICKSDEEFYSVLKEQILNRQTK